MAGARYQNPGWPAVNIDASVALAVVLSGESKSVECLRKTQGVDLVFFQGIVPHLERTPSKIESSLNLADLWTKAITRAILDTLLAIAGRRAGLNHRLEKKESFSAREPLGEQK